MSRHVRSESPRSDQPEFGQAVRRSSRIVNLAPWLIVGSGVGVMIVLFVAALTGLPGGRDGTTAGRPGFSPAWPFGVEAAQSTDDVDASTPPPTSAPAAVSSTPGHVPTPPRRTTPPPTTKPAPTTVAAATPSPSGSSLPVQQSGITGRYRVIASFDTSFQGEVLVANTGRMARHWTVELRFPENVGPLWNHWVESAPQATVRQSGNRYVFTSTAPLAPGASVRLRFQLARSGKGNLPIECRASGAPCTGY